MTTFRVPEDIFRRRPLKVAVAEELASRVHGILTSLQDDDDRTILRIQHHLQRSRGCGSYIFPHGWCDFASFLMAGCLARKQLGKQNVHVVRGLRDGSPLSPHWWVRVRTIDIDITAMQFSGKSLRFAARRSRWHRTTFLDTTAIPAASRPLMPLRDEILLARLNDRVEQRLRRLPRS